MSLETSKILFRSQIINKKWSFRARSLSLTVFTRFHPDFSSLSRFGFVLTWNGFKFENKVNYMIITYIVTLKIDYNPKGVIFLNWTNFVIF